jgi:hypothetical protein
MPAITELEAQAGALGFLASFYLPVANYVSLPLPFATVGLDRPTGCVPILNACFFPFLPLNFQTLISVG